MKNLLNILILLFFGNLSLAQAPNEQQPTTITVKGNYSGIYTTTLSNGQTETIIACVCSENTCYTITTNLIPPNGQEYNLESDCSGSNVRLINLNTHIKISLPDGTLLFEGDFISYSNYPNNGNLLSRNNIFIYQ